MFFVFINIGSTLKDCAVHLMTYDVSFEVRLNHSRLIYLLLPILVLHHISFLLLHHQHLSIKKTH